MKIKSIIINNFRKLKQEVKIDMDNDVLIVGKNNTGKTSVFEVFQKFFQSNGSFKFEDFNYQSISTPYLNSIYDNYSLEAEELKNEDLQSKFPSISISLVLQIAENDNIVVIKDLLYEFENNEEIILECKYEIENAEKALKDFNQYILKYFDGVEEERLNFCDFFKRKYMDYYSIKYYSKKEGSDYLHEVNNKFGKSFLNVGVINAQREVDDTSDHQKQTISNSIWEYYNKVSKKDSGLDLEDQFKNSIGEIKGQLNNSYEEIFEALVEEINTNALNNEKNHIMKITSEFSIEEVLKKNSKLRYELSDLILPESYNGLGYSNMLSMFIQVLTYKHEVSQKNSLFNILFIEEPESHLHPQMQSVFLKRIDNILDKESNVYKVITSHSSYILQTADLQSIRYFLSNNDNIVVRSLQEFFILPQYRDFEKFIKRYFKINTCDLFFTDKAILVEGTVERILMPILMEKYGQNFFKQHITIIEVGGAYAHIFNDLLSFLQIKTLIITDIDSVSGSQNEKCKCDITNEITGHLKIKTSNGTIKEWFGREAPLYLSDIVENLAAPDKLINPRENKKITFQLPINGEKAWGRTFEEQLIIENAELLVSHLNISEEPLTLGSLSKAVKSAKSAENKKISLNLDPKTITISSLKEFAFEIVDKIEKTDFALDLLLIDEWSIPNYIEEGFEWLK